VKRNKECLDGLKITQNKGPAHEWDIYSINEKGDPKTKAKCVKQHHNNNKNIGSLSLISLR